MNAKNLLLAAALFLPAAVFAAPWDLLKKAAEKAKDTAERNQDKIESVKKTASAFRKSAAEISDSEEHYIGRAVAAEILAKHPPVPDALLQGYVQAVGEAVAMASPRPETYGGYHFLVLDAAEPNALAAPGGFIFITKGLLEGIKTEDELAAVLAHEIAHVAERHGLKTIKKSRLTQAFSILAVEAGKNYGGADLAKLAESFDGAVGDIVNSLVVKGYSREAEYEADREGCRTSAGAGYAPEGMKGVLENLGKMKGRFGWYKTHPSPKARLKELRDNTAAPAPWHKPPDFRQKRFARAMKGLS